LGSADRKLYLTSLRVAVRLKLPELEQELPRALQSKESEVVGVAAGALNLAQTKAALPLLTAGLKEADHLSFPVLCLALIRSGDARAQQAVVEAYGAQETTRRLAFVKKANFAMEPALETFLQKRVGVADEFGQEAFAILVSQVTLGVSPCDRRLMGLALPRPRKAAQSKTRDEEAEILITVVAAGGNPSGLRPDFSRLKHGQEAVDLAQTRLKSHP